MKKVLMVLFSFVLVFALVACGEEKLNVTVKINNTVKTVKVGETLTLNIEVQGTDNTGVTYSSNKTNIATVSDQGVVTGVKAGSAIITVTSVADPTVNAKVTISVKAQGGSGEEIDLGGYEITIAYSPNSLYEMDPFLEYGGSGQPSVDREYRRQAFEWVEETYNCHISVKGYPVVTDGERWPYINQQATNGTTEFDIYWVPTKYLADMQSSFLDLEDIYASVAPNTLSDSDYMARVVKGKLKGWSYSDNSITSDDPVIGVNISLLEEIGMADKEPAIMYQNNQWSFSNFRAWVLEIQAALDGKYGTEDKHYAITGMLNDYVVNMSRASGTAICDPLTGNINLETAIPAKAANLLRELCELGCVDPANSPDAQSIAWNNGNAVLCYGTSYWVGYYDRWRADLWGEGTTEFAYSPFPYDDSLSNTTNRFATYTQDTFTLCKDIPWKIAASGIESDDLTPENILRAWYMTYQKTKDLIAEDIALGKYDEEAERRKEAANKWSTEASIEVWLEIAQRLKSDPAVAIFDPINELDNHWSAEYAEAVAGYISPALGYTEASDYSGAVHQFVQDLQQKFTAKYK